MERFLVIYCIFHLEYQSTRRFKLLSFNCGWQEVHFCLKYYAFVVSEVGYRYIGCGWLIGCVYIEQYIGRKDGALGNTSLDWSQI